MIATPEGVHLALPLANIGSRFMALLIDSLIGLAAMLVALIAASLLGGDRAATIVAAGATLVFYIGYHVVFEVFGGGRTPGKRFAGLRVVSDTGAPVGLRASLIRNVLRLLEVGYLPGLISVLATRNNQRIGDLMAGTLVVRDPPRRASAAAPPLPSIEPVRYASWDVTGVSDGETNMVRAFMERRTELQPAARRRLAATLAGRLRPKVAGARAGLDDEAFLELLAAAKARGLHTERSETHYPA